MDDCGDALMVTNVPDQDDKAIAWLTENPKYIYTAWNCANVSLDAIIDEGGGLTAKEHREAHKRASCLFEKCGDDRATGCLTQVAHADFDAGTQELTAAIRADKDNIPRDGNAIEVKDLPVFAKWRRRIDRELAEIPQ